jgi:hypothetical protein
VEIQNKIRQKQKSSYTNGKKEFTGIHVPKADIIDKQLERI